MNRCNFLRTSWYISVNIHAHEMERKDDESRQFAKCSNKLTFYSYDIAVIPPSVVAVITLSISLL